MKLVDFILPEFGLFRGRDAINILETRSKNPKEIEVIASVSRASFGSKHERQNKFVELKFIFQGVLLYKLFDENIRGMLTQEEFTMLLNNTSDSVIMQIENSELSKRNSAIAGGKKLHHLIVETYDFTIECLCADLIVVKI